MARIYLATEISGSSLTSIPVIIIRVLLQQGVHAPGFQYEIASQDQLFPVSHWETAGYASCFIVQFAAVSVASWFLGYTYSRPKSSVLQAEIAKTGKFFHTFLSHLKDRGSGLMHERSPKIWFRRSAAEVILYNQKGVIMESVMRTSGRIDVTRQRIKQDEGVRIAVVEDDKMYRHAIEVYLKKVPDSRVVSFDSGEQCFRHYHNVNPDILILDYSLSGEYEGSRMNGLDVLRKVKSMRPTTKVIFLAGQGNIDVATAAMKGGAIDFITKDKNGLIRLVNQVQRLSLAIQVKREETRTSKWIALGVASIAIIVLATLSADSGDTQGIWGWMWAALLMGTAIFLIRSWVKQSNDTTVRQTRTSRRNPAGRWLD